MALHIGAILSPFQPLDRAFQRGRIERLKQGYPATSRRRLRIRKFIQYCSRKYRLSAPILDIGAGYRSNEPEICCDNFVDFYTLDVNPSLKPDFLSDAADMKQIPTESVGTCVCTELLEHAKSPQLVVSEILRVLQPTGFAIFTVPFFVPVHEKMYQQDYWRFTPRGIALLIRPLEIAELQTFGHNLAPENIFVVAQKSKEVG